MSRNSNSMSLFQANRPASRRLHRRSAVPVAGRPCPVSPDHAPAVAPQRLIGLAEKVVREAGMLELLAAEMRIAELEAALEEARSAAFTDPLTGALNRRGFERAYAAEVARVRRRGGHLALVMIDLDDFKAFNDRHGHLAGDRALAHFVSVLQATMRPSDVLCRFGGEEFVMLLPDTTVTEACTAARRFLAAFSSRAIPGLEQSMTFSAGAVGHDGSESLDDALERADAATYAAKRTGKNRVVAG
jgi:diguanylate cyclase